MIKLEKYEEPEILKKNSEIWTNQIIGKIAANEKLTQADKTRYRQHEIKTALIGETNGKCAYCESKLLHTQHGDIEHIHPKSLAPELSVKWGNLTLACQICNGNKSNKDPLAEHILDPYTTEPSEHIIFTGTFAFGITPQLGKSTISIFDLNRVKLLEERKERLEKLTGIVETLFISTIPVPARKAILEDLINNEVSPKNAYTAMSRALIDQIRTKLPVDLA